MSESDEYRPTFVKHLHRTGCKGSLYRLSEVVHIDTLGRLDNGGIVAHDYRCNMRWNNCGARVLVTERAVHQMAVHAEAHVTSARR